MDSNVPNAPKKDKEPTTGHVSKEGKQLDALMMSSSAADTVSAQQAAQNMVSSSDVTAHQSKSKLDKKPEGFPIRIHFYLGPVVRTEIVYHKPFKTS